MGNGTFQRPSFVKSQRIWLNTIFVLALIAIFVINFLSFRQVNEFKSANNLVFHTYRVMQTSNQIYTLHLYLVATARGYLLTNDPTFIVNLHYKIEDLYEYLKELKKLTFDNNLQQRRVAKLEKLIDERTRILNNMIKLKKEEKLTNSEQLSLVTAGQNLTDRIQGALEQIYQEEFALLQQRNHMLETNNKKTMVILFITNIFSLILLLAIIYLFNRKLTEQMELEAKAHRSQNLLRGIINGTNDYISAVDMNRRYVAFNHSFSKEFKRIFGKRPQIGMEVEEALSQVPKDRDIVMKLWSRALSGEEFTIISPFGKDDARRDVYEVTYSGIYNDKNEQVGASHISRNVSKKIQQQKKIKLAKEEIEEAYRELKKHDDEITMINEMNSALQTASCLDETLAMITNYCSRILYFVRGTLYIINASRNYLQPVLQWNNASLNDQVILPDQCWALRQGKLYIYLSHNNLSCKHTLGEGEDVKPYFCVPLMAQNNIIGLMYLEIIDQARSLEELEKFADSNKFLIENLAGHISLAIANMELQEALKVRSIRDALTGLYNRSYLDESLYRDIVRAKSNNVSLAIIMADLDHFKQINDRFGHEAGDLVLMEVGKVLNQYTRKSDLACRYGGEEFLLMFYDISESVAFERCEEIRKEVNHLEIYLGNKLITPISLSVGIAMYPTDAHDYNDLISIADKALYNSKNTGRNKVTLFSESGKSI